MSGRIRLLLAPGLLCNERLWRPQVEGLGDIAEVVVANLTTQDSIGAMAESVLDLAAAQGADGPFALAGLSMGGYVAMEAALRAPGRVARLALLDTRATLDEPDRAAGRRQLLDLAGQGRFMGVTRRLLPTLIHPGRLDDAVLTETVMAMAREVGQDAFLRQMTAIMARRHFVPELPRIRCPTLVLCGREDARTPLAESELIAAGIRGARLEIVEGCGHLSSLERPDEVNAALRRWLLAGPSEITT